jgi:hypothetical protein
MRSSNARALTSAVKNGWAATCSDREDMLNSDDVNGVSTAGAKQVEWLEGDLIS